MSFWGSCCYFELGKRTGKAEFLVCESRVYHAAQKVILAKEFVGTLWFWSLPCPGELERESQDSLDCKQGLALFSAWVPGDLVSKSENTKACIKGWRRAWYATEKCLRKLGLGERHGPHTTRALKDLRDTRVWCQPCLGVG